MTPEGALFRMDMRLRPEGKTGPLARSLASYEHYYAEWGQTKINLLDTPGFNMFVHEAKMVLPVVDAAIVVVDGVAGVEVVTERVWNYCEEYKTPRVIVASRMDRERADAERVLDSLTRAFGRAVVPDFT